MVFNVNLGKQSHLLFALNMLKMGVIKCLDGLKNGIFVLQPRNVPYVSHAEPPYWKFGEVPPPPQAFHS